jgi:hypothetical protein
MARVRGQRRNRAGAAAALLVLLLSPPASALVIGDFEGAFDGWTTTGAATSELDIFGITATLGSQFMQLRTQGGGVSDAAMEAFFGLGSGTLDALSPSGNDVTEGSATQLILSANAGDELTFDYNFLTREDASRSATYRDFFFSTIRSGEEGEVVREDVLAISRLATSNPNWEQTGWQNVSYNFQTSGTFTIGFGVVDVQDAKLETRLLLDNIRHIPEPSTGLMVSLGLVGLALRRRHGGR